MLDTLDLLQAKYSVPGTSYGSLNSHHLLSASVIVAVCANALIKAIFISHRSRTKYADNICIMKNHLNIHFQPWKVLHYQNLG